MGKNNFTRKKYWKDTRAWLYGKIGMITIAVVLVGYNFFQYDYEINWYGFYQLKFILKEFFSPVSYSTIFDGNLWILSLETLVKTLSCLLLGTVTGFVLAMISAWWSSNQGRWIILRKLFNLLIILLWTLPTTIFMEVFSQGYLPNTASWLIFSWFSWLWLHQYFVGLFNSWDYRYYHYLIRYQKYSSIKAIYYGVLEPMKTKLMVYSLYAIESNLRWSTVLAPLGIIGIGQLISEPLQSAPQHFNQLMIPLFVLLINLIGFELVIIIYQKKINKTYYPKKINELKSYDQYARKINWWKVMLTLIAIILLIYSLSQLNYQRPDYPKINYLLQQFFNFHWPTGVSGTEQPIWLIINLFGQAINIALLGMIFGLIFGLLSSPKFNNSKISYFFLITNAWFRLLPSIVIFYLLNPIFNNNQGLIIIVLTIHSSASFGKKINFLLATHNTDQVKVYLQLGYSKLWIIYHYLWPLTKKEWQTYGWIYFQSIIRTLVIFGIYGGCSLIGIKIHALINKGLISDLSAYLLMLWLGLISLEVGRYQLISQIGQQMIKLLSKISNKKFTAFHY